MRRFSDFSLHRFTTDGESTKQKKKKKKSLLSRNGREMIKTLQLPRKKQRGGLNSKVFSSRTKTCLRAAVSFFVRKIIFSIEPALTTERRHKYIYAWRSG